MMFEAIVMVRAVARLVMVVAVVVQVVVVVGVVDNRKRSSKQPHEPDEHSCVYGLLISM
jgi:hypothetical protein